MKTNQQPGPELAAPVSPTATTHSGTATKLQLSMDNLLVNYHGIFFIMTHLGNYVPWYEKTGDDVLPGSETLEMLMQNSNSSDLKGLTPFQEKRAAKIAENLKKDPMWKLTDEQKTDIREYRTLKAEADTEGIDIPELLRRKEARAEKQLRKSMRPKPEQQAAVQKVKTVTKNGATHFSLGNFPIFEVLRRTLQYAK